MKADEIRVVRDSQRDAYVITGGFRDITLHQTLILATTERGGAAAVEALFDDAKRAASMMLREK